MRQRGARSTRVYGAIADEARERGVVADVVGDHVQPEARGRLGARDRRLGRIVRLGHLARGVGGRRRREAAHAERMDELAALVERDRVRAQRLHLGELDRRLRERGSGRSAASPRRRSRAAPRRAGRASRATGPWSEFSIGSTPSDTSRGDRRLDDRDEARERLRARRLGREQQRRGRAVACPPAPDSRRAAHDRDLRRERGEHRVAELGGRRGAAEVRRRRGRERRVDRRLERRARAPARRAPCSSTSASERSIAVGFAAPVPAMSGAEPCTGSKMPGPASPRLADAARPSPPVTAGGDVGEDVAERVLHHEHVELVGVGDDLHRDAVDEPVAELDVGVVGREPR